jgi:hydroxypyruvate isomerase
MDLYHCQVMRGDLAEEIKAHLPLIGHVQIAGNPGRHEPDVGEIHYPYLFDLLDELGYTGWVGCEYRPRGDTVAGLGWARAYGLGVA